MYLSISFNFVNCSPLMAVDYQYLLLSEISKEINNDLEVAFPQSGSSST